MEFSTIKLNPQLSTYACLYSCHSTGTARRAKQKKKTRTKKLKKRKHSHFGCSKEHGTDGQILNANHKRPESPQKSTGNTVESNHNDKKAAPKAKTVYARQNPDDLCNTQIQTITSNSDCQSTQAEIDVDQVTLASYQSQPHVAKTMDPCFNSLSNESAR
ncbi:hypothetical protein DPMN_049892 [Dreissena polymorpha]|uniref:Uncharacterized protein n=1 Tax=Dreissena polymorpha TaxID=45954 RepID=A0A9D4HMK6_DREPO|nr:hypothetical protein DPMN_049892 [Dreissena polymorpha]